MPVKKSPSATLRASKKNKKQKISEKEIKKAVEKLPGLIVEQVRLSEPAPQMKVPAVEPASEPVSREPSHDGRARAYHNPRKTRWLWAGVLSFCIVIFGLWGWNMYVLITDTTQGAESKSWLPNPINDDLRTVWQEVGASDDESDGNETIKEKIKADLKGLLTQVKSLPNAVATSTTPTTTAESATVSL